jgi:hypothetical protein
MTGPTTLEHGPTPDPVAGGSRLLSVGTALPDKVLTNSDFEVMMDTSDEWIRSRTGIRERRVGGTTTGLAIEAAEQALEKHRRRAAKAQAKAATAEAEAQAHGLTSDRTNASGDEND